MADAGTVTGAVTGGVAAGDEEITLPATVVTVPTTAQTANLPAAPLGTPTTPIAAALPSLGPLAWAVETSPVETLMLSGAVIGAAIGGGLAWLSASLLGSKKPGGWAIAAATVGALAAGAEGYQEGKELQAWMADHS